MKITYCQNQLKKFSGVLSKANMVHLQSPVVSNRAQRAVPQRGGGA